MFNFGPKRAGKPLSPRPLEGRRKKPVWDGAGEPALNDVLTDPIVHALVESDGMSQADLRRFVSEVRGHAC